MNRYQHNTFRILPTLLMFISLFLGSVASAESKVKVESIDLYGLQRTEPSVVYREIGFSQGTEVTGAQIDEAVRNIKATDLFAKVEFELQPGTEGGQILAIALVEKWTALPIVNIATGGGVGHLTLGLFDRNLFGEYIEFGGQFEKMEDKDSGLLWFKDPRLFGSRFGIELELENRGIIKTRYNPVAEVATIDSGFAQSKQRVRLGVSKDFTSRHRLVAFYEFHNDEFSNESVNAALDTVITSNGLPGPSRFHFVGASFDFGRVEIEDEIRGFHLGTTASYALAGDSANEGFFAGEMRLTYFRPFFGNATFAQQFDAGIIDTPLQQYWKYLGGLDSVRGYRHQRFSGRVFWLSNSEVHYPIYERSVVVTHLVGFLDLASAQEQAEDFFGLSGASLGFGIRFIAPKLARSSLRFDLGFPLKKNDEEYFSFSLAQFF